MVPFRQAMLAAATMVMACKSEAAKDTRADAATSQPPPPPPEATSPPEPPPQPESPPMTPKLQGLVDAVATDPLVSEYFRLLLDGLEKEELSEAVTKTLEAASKADVACAYAHVHAAFSALKSEPGHDPRLDVALGALNPLVIDELDTRKMDPAKAAASCPGGG